MPPRLWDVTHRWTDAQGEHQETHQVAAGSLHTAFSRSIPWRSPIRKATTLTTDIQLVEGRLRSVAIWGTWPEVQNNQAYWRTRGRANWQGWRQWGIPTLAGGTTYAEGLQQYLLERRFWYDDRAQLQEKAAELLALAAPQVTGIRLATPQSMEVLAEALRDMPEGYAEPELYEDTEALAEPDGPRLTLTLQQGDTAQFTTANGRLVYLNE